MPKKMPRRQSVIQLEKQVNAWNAANPQGTPVIVTRDNGSELRTTTRSAAWVMSEHSAVIMVNGISGAYALNRVRPA